MEEPKLLIPPFILREAPKEEKAPERQDDPFGGDPLDSAMPNFKKRTVNLHYISTMTSEYGTIRIRPGMTEDDVLTQYSRLFPRECAMYLNEIRLTTQALYNANGFSKERHMMALTKIPEILYTAMKFLREDYWFDKKAFYNFVRKYPKFMIGNHSRKTTRGVHVR